APPQVGADDPRRAPSAGRAAAGSELAGVARAQRAGRPLSRTRYFLHGPEIQPPRMGFPSCAFEAATAWSQSSTLAKVGAAGSRARQSAWVFSEHANVSPFGRQQQPGAFIEGCARADAHNAARASVIIQTLCDISRPPFTS